MPEKRKVVLASRNADKVRELAEVFEGMPFSVVSAEEYPGLPEVIEDGTTILGNATRKAMITAAYTGEIALADDTALQVRELVGFPDIFAARFSGEGATYESNAALLLELMEGVPDGSRQARFETACCWVDPRPGKSAAADGSLPELPAGVPAGSGWFRNPWHRAIEVDQRSGDRDYWNGIIDRRKIWEQYRIQMMADLATFGHDQAKLSAVAERLFATCPDLDGGAAETETGFRLPDPRIWAVEGPDTDEPSPTRVAPAGLDPEAPGRRMNEPFWLEINTEGKLMGTVTGQPVGWQGFGYDPVFRPEIEERTLAEMAPEEKNAISHRARAVRRMMRAVRTAYRVGVKVGV